MPRIKIFLIVGFSILLNLNVTAQITDSTSVNKNTITGGMYTATALCAAGTAIWLIPDAKESLQTTFRKGNEDFWVNYDDYLQYIPIGQMYLADLVGLKARNNALNQTIYLVVAELGTAAVTHTLKRGFDVQRPNGRRFAFPSGHTSQAFTVASVLYHEFKKTHKVLAYSGYVFASATGALRVMNNAHWTSDVLAGAGVAIGVTELLYMWDPLKRYKLLSENVSPSVKTVNGSLSYGFVILINN